MDGLLLFSEDIFYFILQYLSLEDAVLLGQTCCRLQKVYLENNHFWEIIYKRTAVIPEGIDHSHCNWYILTNDQVRRDLQILS